MSLGGAEELGEEVKQVCCGLGAHRGIDFPSFSLGRFQSTFVKKLMAFNCPSAHPSEVNCKARSVEGNFVF